MSTIRVDHDAVKAASACFPKPSDFTPTYGTAGFRAEASLLDSTLFRCGLLAAARSLLMQRACGLMITASHNPARDNGVKLVEPGGEMLPQEWEPLATRLAQAASDAEVADCIAAILRDASADPAHAAQQGATTCGAGPLVIVGYDTRDSAARLLKAAQAGDQALRVACDVAGLVTTPQLHWVVHAHNTLPNHPPAAACLPLYLDTLLGAFEQLVQGLPPSPTPQGAPQLMHVDCANGVGATLLASASERLAKSGLTLVLHNTGDGQLNHGCGADFVQKERVAPSGGMHALAPGARCASIDGDADRAVIFTPSTPSTPSTTPTPASLPSAAPTPIALMDGDKIAALAATLVRDLLEQLPGSFSLSPATSAPPHVGVVQTAYANGASTAYITGSLRLPVECTPTGVKYLHHAAQHFDIGIYWEANGHGTILFSPAFLAALSQLQDSSAAARQLLTLSRMVNQTVGDALSGILLVELVLRRKQWSLDDWDRLYKDLPSRQRKIQVADRSAITTTDAERVCVAPQGLQAAIDRVVSQYPQSSRSFVRPSGTEDAVRVYAEAPSQEQADALALEVCQVVFDLAQGVGERPAK